MSTQDSVVRLVLVDDKLEDAEQSISLLRNGGIAVRPSRPESKKELEPLLSGPTCDIILASVTSKTIPFKEVVAAVNASSKDVTLVALLDHVDDKTALILIANDVCVFALRGKAESLQFAVKREFSILDNRRAVRRLEAALRETERRCDALIASSRDPVAYVHEGMHIRANQAYLDMFGYSSFEEVEGLPLLDMFAGGDANEFKQILKKSSKGEALPKSMEFTAMKADGETFDALMEFASASYEGEPCLQIVMRPQLVDAEMVKELDALRQRDQVTGLFNRTHFLAELDQVIALAAQGGKTQSLLLLELDNYASLLNSIGMSLADDLLKRTAERVSATVGERAMVARFSDHSFAVLSRTSDHVETSELADDLVAAFKGAILEIADKSLSATTSIGAVQIGEKNASAQQVLNKAGSLLQEAQTEGGSLARYFDPAERDRAEEERIAVWADRIKTAIATNDGFQLHFQPICNITGSGEETYQVLLRMTGANGEVVPPSVFLPVAEEHNLIARIDRWVIQHAITTVAQFEAKTGKPLRLFVKMTPDSLKDTKLAAWIGVNLKQTGVTGDRIVLCLDEAKVFTNLKAVQDLQTGLKPHSVRMCLERFGISLNPQQLLDHIRADYISIDRSLIGDLAKNPESQKKVREFASFAHSQSIQAIAEGVQDPSSMTVLFTSSVDYLMGNFIAPPMPDLNFDFSQFG